MVLIARTTATSFQGGTMWCRCSGRFQLNAIIETLIRFRSTPATAQKAPSLTKDALWLLNP
ncbi:MAG: hypothetical protein P8Y77_00210 [Nitrospirota bacterium]